MTRQPRPWLAGVLTMAIAMGCQGGESPSNVDTGTSSSKDATTPSDSMSTILKISVLAGGDVLMDGKPSSLEALSARLVEVAESKGSVYYYREGAGDEPHPNAMKVMQLVVEHRLPITLSTKPDFSDYVDEQGRSHPRQ